jgi:hypothetical protein
VTGPRLRRPIVETVVALAATAVLSGCGRSVESPAGLLVTSGGSLFRLDDAGALQPVDKAPGDVRHLAAAGRSLVVLTDAGQILTAPSNGSSSADDLAWRPLNVAMPDAGFTTGIDVSPDGGSVAIVRGHDDADRLELDVVDLATGAARTRSLDVVANGPPSWLTSHEIALEVVGNHGSAEVVSVGVGGDSDGTAPDESRSRGFALTATADGGTIALADDDAAGVVVRDRRSWWAGDSGESEVDPPAVDKAVQDVAIDADGTRLAVVYAEGDSDAWTLVVDRLRDGRWETVVSTQLDSAIPPSIDWLE